MKCCRVWGKCTRDCCLSEPLNVLDGPIEHPQMEDGMFFVGIFSKYDDNSQRYLEFNFRYLSTLICSWYGSRYDLFLYVSCFFRDRIFFVEQCKAVDCGRPYSYKYKNPWENKDKSAWVK